MESAVEFFLYDDQRYDTLSGKVGKIFVGILSVEIDGVCDSKWNADGTIGFQSVIPQYSQGVNNSAQIRKRILSSTCGIVEHLTSL